MSLGIVHYNDPVLRRKGEKITSFDSAVAALAQEMVAAMHEARGIGLAAQQVGRALQLFVVDLRSVEADFEWTLDGGKPPLELFMPMVVVNPKVVVDRQADLVTSEEGCLSFPEIRGDIERVDRVTATYRDQNGLAHTLQCSGLFARCILHETDHVNGILFIDRMTKAVRAGLDEAVKELAKRTRAARAAAAP